MRLSDGKILSEICQFEEAERLTYEDAFEKVLKVFERAKCGGSGGCFLFGN